MSSLRPTKSAGARWLDDVQAQLVRSHAQGGRMLEVGCGTGLILDRLRGDFDEVVGVGLSEGMLEHARARALTRCAALKCWQH